MGDASRGFRVRGRVQGVGFRWATRRKARELGLSGTVRNVRDGSVEVFVAGDADAVQQMEAWLEHGPRGADVRSLEPLEVDRRRLPASGFEILH